MLNNNVLENYSWEEFASALPRNANDTERLMATVVFRFEQEGVDVTDIAVIINDYFRRARWSRPTNLAATANHCAGKGWLSEAGKAERRKLWRVTRKGYDAIKARIEQN